MSTEVVTEFADPPATGPDTNTKLTTLVWKGMQFNKLSKSRGYQLKLAHLTKSIESQDFDGVVEAAYAFYLDANPEMAASPPLPTPEPSTASPPFTNDQLFTQPPEVSNPT